MSRDAIEYVRRLSLPDPGAARVFVLLAERTRPGSDLGQGPGHVMGLELRDTEIPALAAGIGLAPEQFRRLLRLLKTTVSMDVLEHDDGVWEIVYGPAYTDPKPPPRARFDEADIPEAKAFAFPGWQRSSTWGRDGGHGHLYARLVHDSDAPGANLRIWITAPRHVVDTVDELAEAIAEAIAPHCVLPPPPAVIRVFLTR